MAREFETRNEIEVDATPDQVWDAIATGPGIDSWFMGRTEVEPHEGGTVRTTIGDDVALESSVTAWDPPHRLAYRTPEGEDGTFHAFEILVEGRARGSTVVRVVHNCALGDDWEAEYDALKKGDRMYVRTLGAYLTHFAPRIATASIFVVQPHDHAEPMAALRAGLRLAGAPADGDRVQLSPAGPQPIDGVVDYATPDILGLRTADSLYRFIQGHAGTVVVEQHAFFPDFDPKRAEAAWQCWLAAVYA